MDDLINTRIEEGASGIETSRSDLLSNLVLASSREEITGSKAAASNYLSHAELRG